MRPLSRPALATAGVAVGLAVARGAWRRWNPKRFSFAGKRVLVTGGSRGLGLAIARELAARRAELVLLARDAETLERARDELAAAGARVDTILGDVAHPDVAETVHEAERRFGPFDVVVNDAGTMQVGPIGAMRQADFVHAMDTHFWGPLRIIEAVLPTMRVRGRGRIVNIASVGAVIAVPHLLPYSASKFALRGLSEGLRAELAREGIVVTTVCPGLLRTGSPRNAVFKGDHVAEYAWFAASDAMPLLSMDAERAARHIVRACERGDGHVILTFAAKVAALCAALFPDAFVRLLARVERVLPDDTSPAAWFGWESSRWTRHSRLAARDEAAARRNNEVLLGS